jgi:hypothetical protein
VEEGDDGTFEFGTTTSVDGGGRERFPDDGFTNVGGDEQRDTGSETITFLEEFVEKDDNEGGDDELDDEKEANSCSKFGRLTVHASQDVNGGLS